MTLRVYNTLTRQKENFEPLTPGVVRMYVCGPTVYSDAHVGHAMSSLVYDIIRRYLEYRGYKVTHVMNYTDVDDKIINRANEIGEDPFELAERYTHQYENNLQQLNILPPTVTPRATQEMEQIIDMVQGLIEMGYAYQMEGDVYFRVDKDDDYGKLSRRKLEDMQAGARIGVDERKENPLDFALWKSAKPDEPYWGSPWGKGRPGWHIECSAMNLAHLGEQIDIHGGGNDLIFPHHENEIAQTESLTGKPFVRYWLHNGMLQLSSEKMSKSLGNFITIDEFLQEHESSALRMVILNSSYRSPLTFNDEVIAQAEKALERLRSALRPGAQESGEAADEAAAQLESQIERTEQGFVAAMDDDFNTAGAVGHLFELVRAINQSRDAGVDRAVFQKAQEKLVELGGVLGLQLEKDRLAAGQAEPFIDLLIEIRRELRSQKLWALSDQIRDELKARGVILEDSKDGTNWHWE